MKTFKEVIQSGDYVVLDTETTGINELAEIVEIAIVDSNGNPLLNTLVMPSRPIPAEATKVHGIHKDMLFDYPQFPELADTLCEILNGKNVVVYNAVFDRKMLHQSAERWAMEKIDWKSLSTWYCAMEEFAEIYGEMGYYGNYKWQKLSTALSYYKIDLPNSHRALDDALAALAVSKAMYPPTETNY
jgi:DNA polymerase III epsilon subunit family exonuclease